MLTLSTGDLRFIECVSVSSLCHEEAWGQVAPDVAHPSWSAGGSFIPAALSF